MTLDQIVARLPKDFVEIVDEDGTASDPNTSMLVMLYMGKIAKAVEIDVEKGRFKGSGNDIEQAAASKAYEFLRSSYTGGRQDWFLADHAARDMRFVQRVTGVTPPQALMDALYLKIAALPLPDILHAITAVYRPGLEPSAQVLDQIISSLVTTLNDSSISRIERLSRIFGIEMDVKKEVQLATKRKDEKYAQEKVGILAGKIGSKLRQIENGELKLGAVDQFLTDVTQYFIAKPDVQDPVLKSAILAIPALNLMVLQRYVSYSWPLEIKGAPLIRRLRSAGAQMPSNEFQQVYDSLLDGAIESYAHNKANRLTLYMWGIIKIQKASGVPLGISTVEKLEGFYQKIRAVDARLYIEVKKELGSK